MIEKFGAVFNMFKKLLIFLACVCLFFMNVDAVENEDTRIVVFDFGDVIVQADTVQMTNFLINSFNITKDELSNAYKQMQIEVSNDCEFIGKFLST